MATTLNDFPATVTPTPDETRLARQSSRQLAERENSAAMTELVLSDPDGGGSISLPPAAFRLLREILSQMAEGNSLTILPVQTELTLQQAAEVLNVSLPFLSDQLNQGLIPFHGDGPRRRVRLEDALVYKQRIDRERLKALEELAAQAQELGLGY